MADGDEIKVNVSTVGSKTATVSGGVVDFVVVGNVADVIEMEDVLFHFNSNVLMPESPEGKSSKKDKGKSKEEQKALTGVKALAMVFKHAEQYPNKRLLVTGHTDTKGGIADNFDLSKQRAKGVLYLLKGDDDSRGKWCENCFARHKVEDFQQILNYFRGHKPNWSYRLLNVDSKCGSRTCEAIDGFVEAYNRDYAIPNNWEALPANLSAIVKASSGSSTNRKWPKEQWRAIFRLYTQILCKVLDVSSADKLPYSNLKFLSKDGTVTEMVGCGHSFPVDALGRKNYRSQADRRVEILFFGKDKTPDMSTCPPGTDALHKKGECPIWNKYSLTRNYIDSGDLYAIMYHLKFEYYNPITKTFMCLPNTGLDLKIKAYQKKTDKEHDKATEIPTVTEYEDGVYSVKVRFTDPNPDFTNKHLYFGFETTDKWIYTKDKDSTPEIKTVTKANFDKLDFDKQFKHYQLPAMWYSFNYWTRYDSSDDKKGDLFQKAVKDERKLKPFGDKVTASDKPLAFSLDDIVLVDESDTDKEDINQDVKDQNQSGANKKLCEGGVESRVKLFIVDDDPAKANATKQLKLYRKTANDPKTARIKFSRNVITEKAPGTKIVAFRDGFYTVTGKRVNKAPVNWANKGFVIGARTAHRNAKGRHLHWEMKGRAGRAAEYLYTGDYDLHYFHHLHMDGASPVSFLIIYMSMAFMRDTRPYSAVSPPTRPASAEVKKFVDEGVYNAMNHWNLKGYWLEETQSGM
ncbi:MAG: OmpA family protein, partial [candidate division Zixibacteria bacterium]|nr:OmpA family protein [candidate division Zixibacteria bacterium]